MGFVDSIVIPGFRRAFRRLNARERLAIAEYINNSRPVNDWLRGHPSRGEVSASFLDPLEHARILTSALRGLRPRRGTSFRGLFLSLAETEDFVGAPDLKDSAFLSTVIDFQTALVYAQLSQTMRHESDLRSGRSPTPGTLVLLQVDGLTGRDVADYRPMAAGREVLYAPGSRFRKLGQVFENGILKAHLVEHSISE